MRGKKRSVDTKNKISVLFVDEGNDLQSQIAEYFLTQFYPDKYEVRSAGPKYDHVDCELVSVMYQNGYDIRRSVSKDFNATTMLTEFDYIVFLQQATYDRIRDVMTIGGKHIVKDFGSTADFKANDDIELAECYLKLTEAVKKWVEETFGTPNDLRQLVAR